MVRSEAARAQLHKVTISGSYSGESPTTPAPGSGFLRATWGSPGGLVTTCETTNGKLPCLAALGGRVRI